MDIDKLKEAARLARMRKIDNGEKLTKNPIEKAIENPQSLRLAINAKCYDCIGQDADPDWRGSIRNCVCVDCPLFAVRPYKTK